uniref:Lysine-specific demethylase JMJ16 isoform X2 n=1 Tax=Nicotiana tabacum TaxID=4097 RepID=A0A1S4BKU2_TOBAC|nr:PREDICTED: putative lysine-specific demethylase JMJ16 isoform X2 [Nicotiana tabacum]
MFGFKARIVIARCRPELARIPSLEEAPVFHPSEEEFEDTLKYVASILPHIKHYGICRIVPPSSWKPPSRIEEESTVYGVNTHIQRTSDLQNLFFKKRLEAACTRTNNKQQKILSRKSDFGHGIERKEFGCCNEHFEFENGPKLMLKYFKHYADHFKKQYFVKEDQITASEPSIQDIEGEYWRIIENPTEEIEVLQGTSAELKATESGFPHERDVTSRRRPQYVESGWNLNNTPKLQDSLLRFGSCESSSILLPRLSIGMCFSSNLWRIEEHHLYLLSYIQFGAPKIFYGVPGSYRCKFEEAVKKHLPQLSAHPCLLQNTAFQFSPSILTSEGIPVYRCVQNPKEFVLILPGAYHAHVDSGFNCSEAVNFAPFDWLPHGQNAVELYSEQGRKTSISYDKLLFEAATEGIRSLAELPLLHKKSFDYLKWRAVCRSTGILTKALKSRFATEVRRRKYMCASLESRKMEDDFCATVKRECPICYYDLYLSAIGCKCSPYKYTCLLHAKQLCSCAWSEKYLLIRYKIDELSIMVEALDGKVSAVHKWAKEKLGLPVSDISKDSSKDGMKVKSESGQSLDIEQDRKEEVSIPSVGPSARTNNLNRVSGSWDGLSHWPQSKGIVNDKIEVLFPKISQHATVGKNIMTSSSNTVLKKHLALESSSTKRSVIILSDDEN